MEVRGVWRLRDFGPWLLPWGGRSLCAGLGLGGVPAFLKILPNKIEYPPQPKPSAEAPPPRVYQPVREVPELSDVPDLQRWPLFGCSR